MKKLFLGMVTSLLLVQASAQQARYTLPALPYSFDALEPSIDALTMQIHHDKHHAAYVSNLNKAVMGTGFEQKSLEDLLLHISSTNDAIRNNGGGHYNHSLFWTILSPVGQNEFDANSAIGKAIIKQYGSIAELQKLISEAASKRFGSGWAWLSVSSDGQLMVSSTANQDNPLMDVVKERGIPVMGIDVWEHAYYLKYQNKRGDYLEQIWKVVNWKQVNANYEAARNNKQLLNQLKNL